MPPGQAEQTVHSRVELDQARQPQEPMARIGATTAGIGHVRGSALWLSIASACGE